MTFDLPLVLEDLATHPSAAIGRWEQAFSAQLDKAADRIADNLHRSPIILLSGPSASGKTTTAARLSQILGRRGITCHTVSMDDYYRDGGPSAYPRNADGEVDFESPLCLDIPLLERHFDLLEAGETIQVPSFDFPNHRRAPGQVRPLRASAHDVILFEGIHALNDLFTRRHPEAFRIYIFPNAEFVSGGCVLCGSARLRLLRRLLRDSRARGADMMFSLERWAGVLRGEAMYITPYCGDVDVTISSALPYELGVLRPFLLPQLTALPRTVPCRWEVQQARELLTLVPDLDSHLVPESSILREFIGQETAPQLVSPLVQDRGDTFQERKEEPHV